MTNQTPNYLELSDDEIMRMSPPAPPAVEEQVEKIEEQIAAEAQAEADRVAAEQAEADRLAAEQAAADKAEADRLAAEEAARAEAEKAGKTDEPNPLAQADDKVTPPAKKDEPPAKTEGEGKPAEGEGKDKPEGEGADKGGKPEGEKTEPEKKEPTPEDHKAFYERILGSPIKANGKDFQVRSVEEAEKLIQMGLNYTKKVQAMQPHLRVVKMLDNNKLTESDLSYLIDLHQRKPEAIQKLLADSKFDPHTVDADQAAKYVPTDHRVSDGEIQLQAVLDEVETSDAGKELISDIAKQWDEGSRQAALQDPRIISELNRQKSIGLYAVIAGEIERRQVLGELQGIPFLKAYDLVGADMHAKGLLVPAKVKTEEVKEAPKPEPVEVRAATPKPEVVNNDKARAASPVKSAPTPVKTEVNYLDMTDEEFAKHMKGRT